MKASKILEKALSGSKNIRFGDFVKLIEAFGFVEKRIRGSHHIFKHPDAPDLLSVQPDRNRQAKPYQVQQLLALIEEYDLELGEDGSDESGEEDEE